MRYAVVFLAGVGAAALVLHAHFSGWDREAIRACKRAVRRRNRRREIMDPGVPSDRIAMTEARAAARAAAS